MATWTLSPFDVGRDSKSWQHRTWRAMRIHRSFTPRAISAGLPGIKPRTVQLYMRQLHDHGFLRRVRGGSASSYVLVLDPGPFAPVPRSDGTVWEPNQEKVYGTPRRKMATRRQLTFIMSLWTELTCVTDVRALERWIEEHHGVTSARWLDVATASAVIKHLRHDVRRARKAQAAQRSGASR